MFNDTEFSSSFTLFNSFLKESTPLIFLKLIGNVFHNNGPLHLIDVLPISLEHLGNSNDKLSLEGVNCLLKMACKRLWGFLLEDFVHDTQYLSFIDTI